MSIKSKLAALLLAGGVTVTSIFGLSACKGEQQKEQPINENEKLEDVINSQQDQIDELKKQIEDLQKQGEDSTALQEELQQFTIKQELLTLLANSYGNVQAVKLVVATNNQSATMYSTKNKSVATGKDGEDSLFYIYDGEEAKGAKLSAEGNYLPAEYDATSYAQFLSAIKYDILEDHADASYTFETKKGEGIITRTLYSDDEKTEQASVEKYYFDKDNQNDITRIEVYSDKDEIVYDFEAINEAEFNQKYAEIEAKIEELNAEQNANLDA